MRCSSSKKIVGSSSRQSYPKPENNSELEAQEYGGERGLSSLSIVTVGQACISCFI